MMKGMEVGKGECCRKEEKRIPERGLEGGSECTHNGNKMGGRVGTKR